MGSRMRTILAAPLVAVLIAPMLVAPSAAALPPDGGAQGAQWTATADGPQKYPRMHEQSNLSIRMSDGVVLKADVYRPADASGHPVDTRTPVILNLTPYSKFLSTIASAAGANPGLGKLADKVADGLDKTPLSGLGDQLRIVSGGAASAFGPDPKLIGSGYTQVVVDVRGTGGSQGKWNLLQKREQQDTIETIDWVSKQPWSNGKVGMTGVSYSGINQLQAASKRPPALKAIFPVVPSSDVIRDVVIPGGGIGVGFLPFWLAAVNAIKWAPNIEDILRGKFDVRWLLDRLADPASFMDSIIDDITWPGGDPNNPPGLLKQVVDPNSSLRKDLATPVDKINVPTMISGGWHDLFVGSQTRTYNRIPLRPGAKQLVMGDVYHGTISSGLGQKNTPPRLDVLQRAWFDHWLKGIDNGIDEYGPITLKEQGGNWSTTPTFPRQDMTYRRMYLSDRASGTTNGSVHDGGLAANKPATARELTVGPTPLTLCSRDSAQELAGVLGVIDACGKDSRIAEHAALTFTGDKATAPTRLSGPVNLHLNTVQDARDGYWTATVNDVAPDGTSRVLTTGQLTAALRKIDDSKSRKSPNGDYTDPYYTLDLADRQPTKPGEPTSLDVGLNATDAVIQPGHRIRIDVFAGNFPKGQMFGPLFNPDSKPQHLRLDPNEPSFVNLPLDRGRENAAR